MKNVFVLPQTIENTSDKRLESFIHFDKRDDKDQVIK